MSARARQLTGLLALLATVAPAAMATQAVVEGAVRRPGGYEVGEGGRFADAVLAAMPTDDAYALGAAALRPSALPQQRRLKAGLQHDLQALASDPALPPALLPQVRSLGAWLDALPVTGRVRADLDPRRLELDAGSNRRLEPGDRFTYPLRPDTIAVVGAVPATCTLPHAPLRDAADYLRDCPPDADTADRDALYAIQPDGAVQRLGIAAWNRSAPQALAPGAVLYVPLDERALRERAPGFNDALAQFLATQPLPVASP